MKHTFVVVASVLMLASTSSFADLALAKKNACLACHAVNQKIIGPSYQEVAKKYNGKMDAATLAKSIKAGGSGRWGAVPMPPQTALSEADAKKLAEWILAGAK